jgi:multidrug efflux pump
VGLDAAENARRIPVDITTQFQGHRRLPAALGNTIWLIVAAVVAMYIVLGVLYESFIHPITILHAADGGRRGTAGVNDGGQRTGRHRHYWHYFAYRYREENAIMMIDLPLPPSANRAWRRAMLSSRPVCCVSADPDDYTLAALLGALPLMLSTGGRAAPSVRHWHGRWTACEPGINPVYHPGNLSAV